MATDNNFDIKTDINGNTVTIEIHDGQILCSKFFGIIKEKKAFIIRIDTDKNYRFKGLGKKCVQEFEKIARQRGCTELVLASENEESHKFYNKLDFKKNPQSTMYAREIERD